MAVVATDVRIHFGSSGVRPPRMLHRNPSMMPTSGFSP